MADKTNGGEGRLGYGVTLVGMHLRDPTAEKVEEEIERAAACGLRLGVLQVFVTEPAGSKVIMTEAVARQIGDLCKERDIAVWVHGSYLDNVWGRRPGYAKFNVGREAHLARVMGARGLVVHLPKASLEDVLRGADLIVRHTSRKMKIYLETEVFRNTFESPRALNELWAALGPKWGICIDTAHVHAAGWDMSGDGMREFFEALDRQMPIMIHLNDQVWPLGGQRDQHAPLGYGTIGAKPFEWLVRWARDRGIAMIIERNPDKPKYSRDGVMLDPKGDTAGGLPEGNNIEADYRFIARALKTDMA